MSSNNSSCTEAECNAPIDRLWKSARCRSGTRCATSINPLDDGLLHRAEGAHFGHAVPGIGRTRFAADGFVSLQEAGHEEFPGERCEFDAAPFAVAPGRVRVFWIDDAHDGAGLGGV